MKTKMLYLRQGGARNRRDDTGLRNRGEAYNQIGGEAWGKTDKEVKKKRGTSLSY